MIVPASDFTRGIPTMIRAEATARKVNPTGEHLVRDGVTYYRLSDATYLGFDRIKEQFVTLPRQ